MKVNVTRIIQPLDLGDYAEGMKAQVVLVWVNPDRATLRKRELLIETYNRRLNELKSEQENLEKGGEAAAEKVKAKIDEFSRYATGAFTQGIHAWFAEIWSQGANPETHWTTDELVQIDQADPALYQWMKDRTIQMMVEHRAREKKS